MKELSEQDIAALPKKSILGGEGVFVNFDGTYGGMQGDAQKANYKLAGVVLDKGSEGVFVKMTGPTAAAEKELAHLDEFVQSIKENPHGGGAMTGANPHAGMPGMGAMGAMGGIPGMQGADADYDWTAPDAWKKGPDKPMRVVTFFAGEDGPEVYVSVLSGAAGGAMANINRWRQQMGVQEMMTQAQIDALPKTNVLGKDSPLVEVSGEYTNMSGEKQTNATLLGTVCELPGESLFVKMTGPADKVAAEKEHFLQFAQSLKSKAAAAPAAEGAATPAPAPAPTEAPAPTAAPAATPAT